MSHFFFCRLTSFILFWLTVLGADLRNHGEQTTRAEQEMEDVERRLVSLRERIDSLEKIFDKVEQSMHQQSDVAVPRDSINHDDSVIAVEDSRPVMRTNSFWRKWRLRQQQLRHLSFLRDQKRKFVASIFALRHGQGRLPRDLIHSVVNQWTPLTPGMTMSQLIQCRDLRYEAFLGRKCGQEIDHQLSLCNQNRLERITLCSVSYLSTLNLNPDRTVYLLRYVDRRLRMKRYMFAVVDVAKQVQDARSLRTWNNGFRCVKWLHAYRLASWIRYQSETTDDVHLQFDFIEAADKSVIVKIGWYANEIEVYHVEPRTLSELLGR